MREERGQVRGDTVISEPYTLWGSIAGNVKATNGSKLYVRGTIYGDLNVLVGGRVHVYGKVTGNLNVSDGAKVVVSGVIGHDCTNDGGRLYINAHAEVMGKIIASEGEGETQIDPDAKVGER